MKAILLFYLKLLVVFGLLFGLLSALIDFPYSSGFEIQRYLFKALFFGGFMAVLLGTFHILGLKHAGVKSFNAGNLAVKQKKNVRSDINFTRLVSKLKSDPTTQKMELAPDGKHLVIQTGMSWKSWGEKIGIRVIRETANETEYEIVSEPKLRTTLLDNGRNLGNVLRIEKLLST